MSTATASGSLNPVKGTVTWVPPPAGISTTRSLPVSATKTSPAPSTAMPWGLLRPLPMVVWGPPPAGTSTTSLSPLLRMKTSPALSRATPKGSLRPVPMVVWVPLGSSSTTSLPALLAMKMVPGVMVAALTVMVVDGPTALELSLLTVTSKVYPPVAVGVPESTPDAEPSVSPGGRLPLETE